MKEAISGARPFPFVRSKKTAAADAGVASAFIGAIVVLVLVGVYVVSRTSSDRAYREKWKDYYDCGWA
ncbi:hypothetical protein U6B65_10360 [Oscillospiraceae bacterium MB08-C2-2]|nr:hypothetical protein U6B65_10360 [Oscillospiraceae bacterium MB08-C2-2]